MSYRPRLRWLRRAVGTGRSFAFGIRFIAAVGLRQSPRRASPRQITTDQTGPGTLVSVALVASAGTGGERSGFFLPQPDVPRGQSQQFRTAGVHETFSGPGSIPHRDPSWRCIGLHGTAQTVIVEF